MKNVQLINFSVSIYYFKTLTKTNREDILGLTM